MMAGSELQPPDLEEEDYTLKIKDIFGEVIYQAFLDEDINNTMAIRDLLSREPDALIFKRLHLTYGKALKFQEEFRYLAVRHDPKLNNSPPAQVKPSMADISQFSPEVKQMYLLKRKKIGMLATRKWEGYLPRFNTPEMKANLKEFAREIEKECGIPEIDFMEDGIVKHIQDFFNEQRRYKRLKSLKEKLAERLTALIGISVCEDVVLSSNICSKCKREIEKLEKAAADLETFKEVAQRAAKEQRNLFSANQSDKESERLPAPSRFKRCKGNSPGLAARQNNHKKRVSHALLQTQQNKTTEENIVPVVHEDIIVYPSDSAKIEVQIDYPSKHFRKEIKDELDARIIRGIATNEPNAVANAVWDSKAIKELLLCKVEKEVKAECSGLCSQSNPSILKDTKPESIIELRDAVVVAELHNRAPTLERVLRAAVTNERNRHDTKQKKLNAEMNRVRALSIASSVLLKCRNSALSAMSYRLSLLLWHGGAEKQLFTRLCRWGLSMSPWSTLRKVSELGENYDRNIKEWKSHLEKSYDLETVVKSIQSANKEEFVTQVVTERSSGSGHAESTCGHIQRIDVGVLKEKVVVNLSGMFNEAAYCEVSKVLQDKLPNHVYEIALEKVKEEVQSVHGAAYQIIGDNVDMLIKVKHMSSTNC